jgi:hypothetical protein
VHIYPLPLDVVVGILSTEDERPSLKPYLARFVHCPVYGFPRRPEAVEKVVVGPVGGPKRVLNRPKTPHKQDRQPLNRGQKRARRSFSTGSIVFETLPSPLFRKRFYAYKPFQKPSVPITLASLVSYRQGFVFSTLLTPL